MPIMLETLGMVRHDYCYRCEYYERSTKRSVTMITFPVTCPHREWPGSSHERMLPVSQHAAGHNRRDSVLTSNKRYWNRPLCQTWFSAHATWGKRRCSSATNIGKHRESPQTVGQL